MIKVRKIKTKNNTQDGKIKNKSFIEYAKIDCSNMLIRFQTSL